MKANAIMRYTDGSFCIVAVETLGQRYFEVDGGKVFHDIVLQTILFESKGQVIIVDTTMVEALVLAKQPQTNPNT